MRFGLNVPNFGPQMSPEGLARWATDAERIGYETVLLSDHLVLTDDAARRSPAPFWECFATLAWLAAQTSRVRLGAGVVIGAHRHPLVLARITATIDQLSGGRLLLGVGVGWARQAFDVLGVDFHRRGRITDEYLDMTLRAWARPTLTDAAGRLVHTGPQPAQPGGIPVWIGGNGSAAIKRTNRFGTAWHPLHPDLATASRGTAALERGKDFVPRIFFQLAETRVEHPARPLGLGSAAQIRADVSALAELGATQVVLDVDPGDQRLRRDWRADLDLVHRAADVLDFG